MNLHLYTVLDTMINSNMIVRKGGGPNGRGGGGIEGQT